MNSFSTGFEVIEYDFGDETDLFSVALDESVPTTHDGFDANSYEALTQVPSALDAFIAHQYSIEH